MSFHNTAQYTRIVEDLGKVPRAVPQNEGGIGIFGFAVLDIFLIGLSVFVSKDFGFSVLVFNAVCRFSIFEHLVFGFRKK